MKEKLKIAVVSTPTLPVPPFRGYGGTQRGIYDFLTHMSEKGHRLHLFAPKDSDVSDLENVVLHGTLEMSLWVPENSAPIDVKRSLARLHHEIAIKKIKHISIKEGIDIINMREDNVPVLRELCDSFGKNKVVYSLHNIKSREKIDAIKELGITCITHCRNHKKQYEELPNIVTILYGINVESFPFSNKTLSESEETPRLPILKRLKEEGRDYLVNIGGIGENKGQKTCIKLAKETGNALIIAGTPQSREDNSKTIYFEKEVKPFIDGRQINYYGNANEEEKKELLKNAVGFVFPSGFEDMRWEEPFGRAPVEALSCGTPVIAYRKGSMQEIIFDRFNGFLFDTFDEAVEKIKAIRNIDRKDCRRTAEKVFNSKRVADEYEKLFYKIIAGSKK